MPHACTLQRTVTNEQKKISHATHSYAVVPTVACVRWKSSWIDVEFASATAAYTQVEHKHFLFFILKKDNIDLLLAHGWH